MLLRHGVRQALTIIALAAVIVTNVLANVLPLGGQTTGEISNRFPVLITPAGYVFSIWSVIYVGLIAFAIYQALPGQRNNTRLQRASPYFWLSCAANIVWLFLWHYDYTNLSLLPMVVLLLALIGVYTQLETGRTRVSRAEHWCARVPFSIYLGWISVATIVNVAVVLFNLGWGGGGLSGEVWTMLVLVVGLGLAITMVLRRGDAAYALVIAWAFVGVAVSNADTPALAAVALGTAALAGLSLLVLLFSGRSGGRGVLVGR